MRAQQPISSERASNASIAMIANCLGKVVHISKPASSTLVFVGICHMESIIAASDGTMICIER